jgi:hypothetical protein
MTVSNRCKDFILIFVQKIKKTYKEYWPLLNYLLKLRPGEKNIKRREKILLLHLSNMPLNLYADDLSFQLNQIGI